ncbi:HlyD family type I secretion periplasmic adaptor subunit [Nitratireductor sp. GISD-1A_MAKvit]|uniref:HlyD family type I secretion periplasmic adaptor subunit n=1 Tax=Nitratireductor sp. GISD-1A_MAKvit TaxID=3234198 RepID=UPI0034661C6E
MSKEPNAPKASTNYLAPALAAGAIIFLTFGVAGGWAAIAPLDSAVLAQGVVAVENNRRSVQHLEGGIVAEINVTEGQRVKEGDVLFRLDTTRARANEAVDRLQLSFARILEARLLAERHHHDAISFPEDIEAQRSIPAIDQAIENQVALFNERKLSIDGQIDILESNIQQSRKRIKGLETELQATQEQIGFIKEELTGVRKLFEKGHVSSVRLYSLERERARLEGLIGSNEAEISSTESRISEVQLKIDQLRQERLEHAAEEITEVRKTINELRERLNVSSDVLRRTAIVAPRGGTVIGLKVFTKGQVVRAGDVLLEIVPEDEGPGGECESLTNRYRQRARGDACRSAVLFVQVP